MSGAWNISAHYLQYDEGDEGAPYNMSPRRMASIEESLVGKMFEQRTVDGVVLPKDTKSGPYDSVFCDDVLVGRGKGVNDRPGNRHYRVLLEGNCGAYMAWCTTQKEKTEFTQQVVQEVHKFGRFMKEISTPTGAKFVEISDRSAEIRVGQVSEDGAR